MAKKNSGNGCVPGRNFSATRLKKNTLKLIELFGTAKKNPI